METNNLLNDHPEEYSLCLRVRGQLQDYIEGYLDAVAAETVRAHLAVCALCNKEYCELQETIRLIQTLPYLAPSRDFAPPILDAIGAPRKSLWWQWRPNNRKGGF